MSKHEKNENKKHIVIIMQCIFWLILIYSLIQIAMWSINNKQNKKIMEEISSSITVVEEVQNGESQVKKEEEGYAIDFDTLKKINGDTIAFLKVNGTQIEYPIVKTANNEYYLNHSFDKKYNAAGWIFADYNNKFDGSDKNIVIYGHNRKNGTMFSTLKNVLNKKWYEDEKNLKMNLITENEIFSYQVFSVYQIKKEEYYLQTNFNNDDRYLRFIEILKKRSIKDFNIDVNEEDQILTLSTCANDNNYRVVLHAKKLNANQ